MCRAAVADVDCDVKCASVRFWHQYLPSIEQSVTPVCCLTAVLSGGISCLLLAALDCDRVVREEALRSLVDVRAFVRTQPDLLLPSKYCVAGRFFRDSDCEQICSAVDFIEASFRRLPRDFELQLSAGEGQSTVAAAKHDELPCSTDSDVTCSVSALTRLQVAVLSTDWESLLASEWQQTDDCHAGNLASLLDDIVNTAHQESEMSHNIDDGDSDAQDVVIMDCY